MALRKRLRQINSLGLGSGCEAHIFSSIFECMKEFVQRARVTHNSKIRTFLALFNPTTRQVRKVKEAHSLDQPLLNGGVTGGREGRACNINFLLFRSPGEWELPHPIREEPCSLLPPYRGGVTRFCFGEPEFVTVVRVGEPISSPYLMKSGVSSSSAPAFTDSSSLSRFFPARGDDCRDGISWFGSLFDCWFWRGVSYRRGDRGAGCRNLLGEEPLHRDMTQADIRYLNLGEKKVLHKK